MKRIKCNKCGYEWESKGRLLFIICPNCRKFTPCVAKDEVK